MEEEEEATRDVMLGQSELEIRRKSSKLSLAVETATITSTRQDAVLQVSRAGRRVAGRLRESCREAARRPGPSATGMLLRLWADLDA